MTNYPTKKTIFYFIEEVEQQAGGRDATTNGTYDVPKAISNHSIVYPFNPMTENVETPDLQYEDTTVYSLSSILPTEVQSSTLDPQDFAEKAMYIDPFLLLNFWTHITLSDWATSYTIDADFTNLDDERSIAIGYNSVDAAATSIYGEDFLGGFVNTVEFKANRKSEAILMENINIHVYNTLQNDAFTGTKFRSAEYTVTSASTTNHQVVVTGDVTSLISTNTYFWIVDAATTALNGIYKATTATYSAPDTTITVSTSVHDITSDVVTSAIVVMNGLVNRVKENENWSFWNQTVGARRAKDCYLYWGSATPSSTFLLSSSNGGVVPTEIGIKLTKELSGGEPNSYYTQKYIVGSQIGVEITVEGIITSYPFDTNAFLKEVRLPAHSRTARAMCFSLGTSNEYISCTAMYLSNAKQTDNKDGQKTVSLTFTVAPGNHPKYHGVFSADEINPTVLFKNT